MQVEISAKCNKKCKKCYGRHVEREEGYMSIETFTEIVDKIDKSERLANSLYLAGFGESLLNPYFWDMVKYAKRKQFFLMLPTNGTLLSEDVIKNMRMLDSVHLSVDHPNDDVLRWMEIFKKYQINLQLNITIGSQNYENLEEFIRLGNKADVDLLFMLTTPYDCSDQFLMGEFRFCVKNFLNIVHILSQHFGNFSVDIGCITFNKCRYINRDLAVDWNGYIKSCNDMILLKEHYGHISDYDNFDAIFSLPEYTEMLTDSKSLCNNCKRLEEYFSKYNYPKEIYDKRLDYYKDLHKGRKCFVLGHTMALTKEIVDKLKNEITFSVNSIGYAKDLWGFEPTYCAIADASQILDSNRRMVLDKISSQIFYQESIFSQAILEYPNNMQFRKEDKDYIKSKNMIPVKWINPSIGYRGLIIPDKNLISFDLKKGVIESGTSIQSIVIPICGWMGFKDIYMIAVDDEHRGHFYDNGTSSWKPGPDIFRQFGWYAERLEERDQHLYNIGKGGIKNVKNITLEEVLNDRQQ